MSRAHTDREYETQLREIRERLLLMAGHVEEMIAHSVRALVDRDVELARATIYRDHQVNRLEVETDELCLLILAKRQPMASDLRFITLALKMVTDLERIGDLAVNICERALDLADDDSDVPWDDISRMGSLVQSMVKDSIDAFVAGDAEQARKVIERDDEVDELYVRIFRAQLARMIEHPERVARGVHIQSVAKWLERMADHSTNLVEQVIFMVQGRDVRHAERLDR